MNRARVLIGLSSSSRSRRDDIRHRGSIWHNGFTLLELLVSISIITLLIGTGIPAFRHFGRVQALEQAVDQVKGATLDARAYALGPRAQKPADVTSYEIRFDAIAQTYQLFEGNTPLANPIGLPAFVQFTSVTSPIQFSIANHGVVSLPTSGTITVTLSHRQLAPTTTRTLTVNRETGAVNIDR